MIVAQSIGINLPGTVLKHHQIDRVLLLGAFKVDGDASDHFLGPIDLNPLVDKADCVRPLAEQPIE